MTTKKPKAWLAWLASGMLLFGLVFTAFHPSKGLAADVRQGLITELTLKGSNDGTTWDPSIGNLAEGFSVALDPANNFQYLDVNTLVSSPLLKDGRYEFYFDKLRVPAGFWDYWAAQGVAQGAGSWQGIMWQILNGNQPIFYIDVTNNGTAFKLVDGLQFQHTGNINPLRVSSDYPLGTYHYGGWVTDTTDAQTYINAQITFTKPAGVSLRIEEDDDWTIDGCGTLDVIIHLANMHDLYGVDLALSFDPNVLEVVDLDSDENNGINLKPIDDWFKAGFWVYNEANNTAGTIRYTATQLRTAPPVYGEGNIAKIRFRAKAIAEDSELKITKAEFSDRNSFLVGRPVTYTDPAATITTKFDVNSWSNLDIIRLTPTTVQLQWAKPALNSGVESFILHRSTLPYFELGDAGSVEISTGFNDTADPVTYDDPVLGNVANNYFYALQAVCENGFSSPLSQQVGKFEYQLYETSTTDFTWVGLVLETSPEINNARDLANHITSNLYQGTASTTAISKWNPVSQGFTTYAHHPDIAGFKVDLNQPYRVEIDINDVTTGSVIWAQVGKLPEITPNTYTLRETATTSFNWILQPLNRVDITNTNQLTAAIKTEASSGVDVLSVSRWNGIGQVFSTFVSPISTATRFGYPYRVEVEIETGNLVTWP